MNESDVYEFLNAFNETNKYPLFLEHAKYGTFEQVYKDNKLVGLSRYNISPSGRVALLLDMYVLPNQNGRKIFISMGISGKKKFPNVKYIKFDRGLKSNPRFGLVYKLSSLIKE